jgi:preprotein translocase subunit SecE
MSTDLNQEGKKWIQTGTAVICMILAYILISFFRQMGSVFELESKIPYYNYIHQGLAVGISLITFFVLMTNQKSYQFLTDVYGELLKVIWPDKNQTVRHTFGVIIGVTIMGFILGLFDMGAGYLLSLLR